YLRVLSLFFYVIRPPPSSPLFPYTTLFRSRLLVRERSRARFLRDPVPEIQSQVTNVYFQSLLRLTTAHALSLQLSHNLLAQGFRSEEHTSELQSPCNLVCRLLLEKKNNKYY